MSNPFDTRSPSQAAPEAACENAKAIAAAERQLVMLGELAESGMALTREILRRAQAAPEDADDGDKGLRGVAEAFAKVTRAIRLTFALETRTHEVLAALRARPEERAGDEEDALAARRRGPPPAPLSTHRAHRDRIQSLVHEVINAEVTDLNPAMEMLDALNERLYENEAYEELFQRPIRETVERICADLGLEPDWSRWTGEGWTPVDETAPRYIWHTLWKSPRERAWRYGDPYPPPHPPTE